MNKYFGSNQDVWVLDSQADFITFLPDCQSFNEQKTDVLTFDNFYR